MSAADDVAGIVLAGGKARRMGGGDKVLREVAGRPMIAHAIERLRAQVGVLAINANGDPARFAALGLPVVADTVEGYAGPLAGVLAGMRWAQANAKSCRFLASVAGDTPFFPADLVVRLRGEADDRTIALASSGGRAHPVFGLWPLALADDLEKFLRTGETGKVLAFVDRHRRADVDFTATPDPFFNVNTPEDLARADALAAA